MKRRYFLQGAALTAGLAIPAVRLAGKSPGERIAVAVMGVRGRGGKLLSTFASQPDVDIAYVCDVDEGVLNERVEQVIRDMRHRPRKIGDFRPALDDKHVDAL